jgi:hypothetical protein
MLQQLMNLGVGDISASLGAHLQRHWEEQTSQLLNTHQGTVLDLSAEK